MWTQAEKDAVRVMLESDALLSQALWKLFSARRVENEQNAASCMRSLPRQIERASDYAAKAEAWASIKDEIEAEVSR